MRNDLVFMKCLSKIQISFEKCLVIVAVNNFYFYVRQNGRKIKTFLKVKCQINQHRQTVMHLYREGFD